MIGETTLFLSFHAIYVQFNPSCVLQLIFPDPGATEKHKLVYIMNRDAAARLTISSPLEAHKVNSLLLRKSVSMERVSVAYPCVSHGGAGRGL